ncbi:MAG: YdeI family protein [Saprospiraceae bacterium]
MMPLTEIQEFIKRINQMNKTVDNYFLQGCGRCSLGGTPDCKALHWIPELEVLRKTVLACGLTEECKWGVPCYTFQGGNVLLVSAFKDYCAISFFKGALLNDTNRLLEKPGERSQATRLLKFVSIEEILKQELEITSYIYEAIEVEKTGLKIGYQKNPEPIPSELEAKFAVDPTLKLAFEALSPGRQRGYLIYFSTPKQSKTRVTRIEKCLGKILNGEGLHDKYKQRKSPS